jgi:hypothetical protein
MGTVQIAAFLVRTEKNLRFITIRFSAVRQYCCYSKTPTEENGHALHRIMTLNPTSRLPTEAEMASMHELIVEGMKAGWLLECEGVTFGATGVRVHKAASGEVTVIDGPFAEAKEVLGGYALLNAASKEEAVEHTRRFLEHIGQETSEGTWETYQLFEMATGGGQ